MIGHFKRRGPWGRPGGTGVRAGRPHTEAIVLEQPVAGLTPGPYDHLLHVSPFSLCPLSCLPYTVIKATSAKKKKFKKKKRQGPLSDWVTG